MQGYLIAKPQESGAILAASSAASFVKDLDVVQFIDSIVVPDKTLAFTFDVTAKAGLH